MGYSAVKGGLAAISAAELLVRHPQLAADEPALDTRQLEHQLGQAVDKIMSEGGLYDPALAALALKQAEGDLFEAAFLLRAYRSTLPRVGYSLPIRGDQMRVLRRISSAFKDVPGGQLLGRTRDYTQRLLDFSLLGAGTPQNGKAETNGTNGAASNGRGASEGHGASNGRGTVGGRDESRPYDGESASVRAQFIAPTTAPTDAPAGAVSFPKVADTMRAAGLIAPLPDRSNEPDPPDITIDAMRFPVPRAARLQALARGESGAMLSFAYASLRAFGGGDHATVAELRVGDLPLQVVHPLLGTPVTIGHFRATEAEMLGPDKDKSAPGRVNAAYSLSYGLVFGQHERKAISMGILDSTLTATEGEERPKGAFSPAGDQEMVLSHIDPIESSGFIEHLKLPHYVTFGASLQGTLQLKADRAAVTANGTRNATQNGAETTGTATTSPTIGVAMAERKPSFASRDHQGVAAGQMHHHGDGVLHAHDE
jgi:alpha-D-ribose 1-methylphosphonate 5-triphosphate synthase subunit PhnI